MFKTYLIGCVALLSVGCAMGESVDESKSEVATAGAAAGSGATDDSSGGAAGAAGFGAAGAPDDATGGASSASGGSAGADEPPPVCQKGEKLCETGCVPVTPEVGCGSYACSPCKTPPANSKAICDGPVCDFECLPGFARKGFSCVSDGGGTGGSGAGTGGSGGSSAGTGGSGGSGGTTSGTGGGSSVCVGACNPSDPTSQFQCLLACASNGGVGLCAPALNCCVCG